MRASSRSPSPWGPRPSTAVISCSPDSIPLRMRAGRTLRIVLCRDGSRARLTSAARICRRRLSPGRMAAGRHQEPALRDSEGRQPVGGIIGFDGGVEADRRLAGFQERQGGIALQCREWAGGEDAAGLHQHEMVRQALDFGHVVADIEDRERKAFMQSLQEGQDFVFRGAVEGRERLVHQQELRLREQSAADGDALAFAAG